MDYSKIEPRFVKENHLLGLGFPGQGYVFFRVNSIEPVVYQYDELDEIAADSESTTARLSKSSGGDSIDNVLRVMWCDHVYQVFMGWQPGCMRQYLYYPYETARRNLDERRIYSKAPFGFIEGYNTPYDCPSSDTEMFIPYKIDVGFTWYNTSRAAVTPRLQLLVRRLGVDILRDADLVTNILSGKQPCRLVTLGGVGDSYEYPARNYLDVDLVKLGAARAVVEAALAKE